MQRKPPILDDMARDLRGSDHDTCVDVEAGRRWVVTTNPTLKERLIDSIPEAEIYRYPQDGPLYSNGHTFLDRVEASVPREISLKASKPKVQT